ncbi:hypothetical protein CUC08_Gglean013194 [Alternaria sp. MG1]|nr:hypothetical protein CUC08_Gglean013194 [Alternaria sp. MG1]
MPLDATSDETVGQERDHWEDLRENNVPRFLFRMFHRQSGGGPGLAINNATEIVPRGFMNGNTGSSVYGKD